MQCARMMMTEGETNEEHDEDEGKDKRTMNTMTMTEGKQVKNKMMMMMEGKQMMYKIMMMTEEKIK